MVKQYLSYSERQKWLHMCYMSESMEKIIDSDVDYGTALTNLKKSKTFALKAIDEFAEIYPKQFKTLINDLGYYDMLLLPKKTSHGFMDQKLAEVRENPLEALYDVLDVVVPKTCKGCCEVGAECKLKRVFEIYNIPETNETDKLCTYRY